MNKQTQVVEKRWLRRRQKVAAGLCILLPLLMGADGGNDQEIKPVTAPVAAALLGHGTNGLDRLSSVGSKTNVNVRTTAPPGTNQVAQASADSRPQKVMPAKTGTNRVAQANANSRPQKVIPAKTGTNRVAQANAKLRPQKGVVANTGTNRVAQTSTNLNLQSLMLANLGTNHVLQTNANLHPQNVMPANTKTNRVLQTNTNLLAQSVIPATHGTNPVLQAGANPAGPVKIDDSLRRMRKWMTSTNISSRTDIIEDGTDDAKARAQQAQHQFELGLQLRQRKEYDLAVKTLMALVESEDTPNELRRSTLLELAMTAQEQQQYGKAQQILSQYVRNYSEDSSVPEILLRQGQLYRQMGANTLALAKFYAVMTVVLHLKLDHFDYYRRLVLQAQAEIADTHYMAGKYAEAADFFARLLKADSTELSRAEILYKLIQCHRILGHHEETIAKSKQFAQSFPRDSKLAEVRFTLAECYRQLGHRADALQEVQRLLSEQQAMAKENPEKWLYWQMRAGNMLANQFFNEGDYFNALGLYLNLAQMNKAVEWQLPTLYQTALVYEKLRQPEKAVDVYKQIVSRESELGQNPQLSLKAIVDMAKWRASYLGWRAASDQAMQTLRPLLHSNTTVAQ